MLEKRCIILILPLSEYDILSAIKKKAIKKEDVGIKPQVFTDTKNGGPQSSSSIISIRDLLQDVKNIPLISSVLSKDVIDALGENRLTGDLTKHIKYSDRDQSVKTDREILLDALESAAQTEDERKLLRTYRSQKDHLAEAEARVKKLNAEIKALAFAPGKRDTVKIKELTELRDDAQRVVNRADKRLLNLEATKPLKDVLAREKKKVRAAEKIKREKMRAELKEKSEVNLFSSSEISLST